MPSEAHEQLVRTILETPASPEAGLDEWRAGFDQLLLSMPIPDDVETTTVMAGDVEAIEVSVPGSVGDRVVLVAHGGGYCMGSAHTYREVSARIARAARARVIVPDYRLAPEHPYPAAAEDMLSSYRWLIAQGISPERIVVMGDSGGAGLALALVVRARDEDLGLPGGYVGFSPWIDLAVGDSIAQAVDVGDPVLAREGQQLFAAHYLRGHDADDPAVNMLAADLHGLPPMLLIAGSRDITHGDALRLAARARAAGVGVQLHTFHGLIHNWQVIAGLPEAAQAMDLVAAFVDEHVYSDTAVIGA